MFDAAISWISSNPKTVIGIVTGIWELLGRLIPTKRSVSIVNGVKNIIDNIPNNNTAGGVHP